MYLIVLAFLTTLFAIVFQAARKDPPKIFNVYSQPGKWHSLKYGFFLIFLQLRLCFLKLTKSHTKERFDMEEWEKLRTLSPHDKAFDGVFFQAVNSDGYYLSGGIERRHQGKINGLFYVGVPEMGLLSSEHLPKTCIDAEPAHLYNMKSYGGGGICFTPVEAMKTWKVSYNGRMKTDDNTLVDVVLDAEWTSNFPYFRFETDINNSAVAKAIGRERWSRKLFNNLKSVHQTNYHQTGRLKGSIKINGETRELNMESCRSHNFGSKNDWSSVHRYMLHTIFLDDLTTINLCVLSQPSIISHLEVGYVITPQKTIHPIEWCDLQLYQHGENGNPGADMSFSFETKGTRYEVRALTLFESELFKGSQSEVRLLERFMTYEVNGMKGRGVAEWFYNKPADLIN